MKTTLLSSILFLLFLSTLTSCEQEKSQILSSTSEDGEIQVNVQGTRYLSTDPFNVSIVALTKYDTLAVEVEAAADKIDEENVSFTWEGNNKCYVYITQRDGQVVTVPITIME